MDSSDLVVWGEQRPKDRPLVFFFNFFPKRNLFIVANPTKVCLSGNPYKVNSLIALISLPGAA